MLATFSMQIIYANKSYLLFLCLVLLDVPNAKYKTIVRNVQSVIIDTAITISAQSVRAKD